MTKKRWRVQVQEIWITHEEVTEFNVEEVEND